MPTKMKSSILIFGIIVMCLMASLATFLVLAACGVLNTEKAKVEITVQAATKVYDGTPLVASEYKIEGELAEGHKEVVTFTDSLTDASERESGAEVRIVDEDGYDVTSEYSVKVNKGILRVTRQSLSVAIGDKEVVYSGERIVFDDYILQKGLLAKGHKIGAESAVGVIKPGVVDGNSLTPAVYDAFGNDVTGNYDISFAMGTVKVVPRPLVVRAKSVSKVYDGKALIAKNESGIEITSGSLIAGHYLRATGFQTAEAGEAQLTERGKLPVFISGFSIFDENGTNVSEYYKVTNELNDYGVLEITPRPLTVVGKSKSWEYDGKAHGFTSIAGREDTETSAEMAIGLAEGHSVVINYDLETGKNSITEVGTVPCQINSANVKVLDAENNDLLKNYTVTYINGTLTVTPKPMRITINDYTVEYSGQAISDETLKEQIVLFDDFKAEDFDLVKSQNEFKNAGVYSLSVKPSAKAQTDGNKFKNYELDIVPATVTITKKSIDIRVNDFTTEYTGAEVSDKVVLSHVTFPENFSEDSFEVVKDMALVNAGQYSVSVKFKAGSEPDGDDYDSDNYKLSVLAGTLTITPKKVGVKVMDYTVEYSGQKIPDTELNKLIICGEGLDASDFKVTGDAKGFIDVGKYVIDAEFLTEKEGNAEKLKNYVPDVTPGTLTVTKKKVPVLVNNAEAEYTSDKNSYGAVLQSMLVCEDTALAPSKEEANGMLEPVIDADYSNAGSYTVSARLRENVEENVKKNIEISVTVGMFTVRPKTVSVQLSDGGGEYTGFGVQLLDITAPDSPVEGLTVKILSSNIVGVKDAGSYSYTADMVLVDEGGASSPNYTVRSVAGVWTITPQEVTVEAPSEISHTYDGKPISVDCSQLKVSGAGGNYSVISADNGGETWGEGSVEVILKNIRIRDNSTGMETFNVKAADNTTVNVTLKKRKLQISIGSITVKEGTTTDDINTLIRTSGVPYTLMGLADGDIVTEIYFSAIKSGEQIYTSPSVDGIQNQNEVDVKEFYDFSEIDKAFGTIFFI